jgi:hypothetical protein
MMKYKSDLTCKTRPGKGAARRESLIALLTSMLVKACASCAMSANLTIRALASQSGLAVNTLSLIENGKTSPSVSTLQQLARHGCSHHGVF